MRRNIVMGSIGFNDATTGVGVGRSLLLLGVSIVAKLLLLIDYSWFTTLLSRNKLILLNLLNGKQKTVVHQVELLEECHILFDLLLNFVDVTSFEFDEVFNSLLFVAFYSLQIDVFKGRSIFNLFCDLHLSVDHGSFQIKHVLDGLGRVASDGVSHQKQIYCLNILHLNLEDTINSGNQTIGIVFKVFEVFG
jgi:hypothetical protein